MVLLMARFDAKISREVIGLLYFNATVTTEGLT